MNAIENLIQQHSSRIRQQFKFSGGGLGLPGSPAETGLVSRSPESMRESFLWSLRVLSREAWGQEVDMISGRHNHALARATVAKNLLTETTSAMAPQGDRP